MTEKSVLFLCTKNDLSRGRLWLYDSLSELINVRYLECRVPSASDIIDKIPCRHYPNLALYPDINRNYIPEGLEALPFPTACLQVDSYYSTENRVRLAKLFDLSFVYHPYTIEFYSRRDNNVISFPHAIPKKIYINKTSNNKGNDVAMIGRLDGSDYEYRRKVSQEINGMPIESNDMEKYYPYEEMVKTYSGSKVSVNVGRGDYKHLAHLSCLEIIGSGSLLITTRDPRDSRPHELEELGLSEGKHYDTFASIEELREKLLYYLDHDAEREKMASQAQEHVLSNHTYGERARELLAIIEEGIDKQAPARDMPPDEVAQLYVDYFSKRGRIDKTLSHLRKQRNADGSTGDLLKSTAKALKATVRGWQRSLMS